MAKYEMGLINQEGDIRRWREVGKEVTVYSSFRAPEIGIQFQEFSGKIFIDRNRIYLCWDKYTACFSTETGEPIRIKRNNNEPLWCQFFVADETYKGRLRNSYQMVIDDEASKVYLIYREKRTTQKMIYTDRKSKISFITDGQMTRDNVLGHGKNHATYACIIKKGVPTFATSNGSQPTFEPVTFMSVKAFKQGPYVFFINSERDKASVIDTRNGCIIRFTHAKETSHVGAEVKGKSTGKSSVSIGDTCSFEFNPDGTAYKIIHEEGSRLKVKRREDILGDKTYWIDFSPGASIFLP